MEDSRLRKAQAESDLFTLGAADKEIVDLRMKDLSEARKYIKSTHIPFETLPGKVLPKAADWYAILFDVCDNVSVSVHACNINTSGSTYSEPASLTCLKMSG
jgi:hypothetical protein